MRKRIWYKTVAKIDWESVDWTLNDSEVARLINADGKIRVQSCQAGYHRRRLGKPMSTRKYMRPDEFRPKAKLLDDADWTKQDIVLARENGCTREYVRQKRRRLGKPDPVNKQRPTYKTASRLRAENLCSAFWRSGEAVSISRLMKMAGCGYRTITNAIKAYPLNIVSGRDKYDWASVDWTKRNGEIAKQLGCNRQVVASKRCYWVEK